ncbi:thiamine phosphate synthase [Bartonella sp. TP]|uniref:thiamine phosphate synthase n=1 Tax=Bartonella sp. TP TaxID=3057550 RepID=UPI0025B1A280|nr:thiamine phosphate synthase [Bartonella sp. TP]MDN5248714.1 thiamine phosphate synthase [Alphaproteobacteria bacterium]WJW79621.1 thiamine phosphate synthase [Bartonella sp. TP]
MKPNTQQLFLTCEITKLAYLLELEELGTIKAVIIYNDSLQTQWQKASAISKALQKKGLLVILKAELNIVNALEADGLHVENDLEKLKLIKQTSNELIIGYGAPPNKHNAMLAGEYGADYLFFGALGRDDKNQPHPRNLALCSWWSEVMQIPAVIQCGKEINYLENAKKTEAEYISIDNLLLNSFDKNQTISYIGKSLKGLK